MAEARLAACWAAGLGAMLALHGALPFLAMPTLGQAVWTTGFSQSFLNDSLFSIHATNFGAPQPAPISFGLAGAWPAAALIACGLHPADAYAAMAAFWLSVAYFCAWRLARSLGAAAPLALLAAVLWLTMPMIWTHAGYSMLSLGFALLPFYFGSALALLERAPAAGRAALHAAACVVAAFMDGYTFVMFAAGAGLLGAWRFLRSPEQRGALLRWALPVHAFGVALGAGLYLLYAGELRHGIPPLEAFRGWGVDLAYVAVPTQGVLWLADLLGLSVSRSEERLFGDPSVWRSTFALPLIAAALWAWWRTRRSGALATACALMLAAGFYMALGPSLKVGSAKPAGWQQGPAMPPEHAVASTGSAWLSTLPVLRNMRSSYRWLALSVFSAWLLLVLLLAARERRDRVLAAALAGGLVMLNLPDLRQKWREDAHYRAMFLRLDAEILADVRQTVTRGERVAFLPYRNDFLVNYLSARAGFVAYNIGGDKNLEEAERHWPPALRSFRMGVVDERFAGNVGALLQLRQADVVLLPYVDLLWAAHRWPAPDEFRGQLQPALEALRASPSVAVADGRYYAAVRLRQNPAENR